MQQKQDQDISASHTCFSILGGMMLYKVAERILGADDPGTIAPSCFAAVWIACTMIICGSDTLTNSKAPLDTKMIMWGGALRAAAEGLLRLALLGKPEEHEEYIAATAIGQHLSVFGIGALACVLFIGEKLKSKKTDHRPLPKPEA